METSPSQPARKPKPEKSLAAIRLLKLIERDQRAATTTEKLDLARFGGFGPVALSIFPDPVTGRFKDAGWEQIGGELKSLLTPEEYDSAKRTTFSQFFTAPVVMEAMHEALARLGVPQSAVILEPGCGVGNFMSAGKPGQRFIGVELDSISGRIARLLHPEADIRIENFRDTKLPALDAVIGNVPFADVKLEFKGERLSLHDYFIAKSVDSLKPGGVLAVVTSHYTMDKQNAAGARKDRRPGRFPRGDPTAVRRVQAGGHQRHDRHPVPQEAGTRPGAEPCRPGMAGNLRARD